MRSFLASFLLAAGTVLGAVGGFNYAIDPLQFFRVYGWGRPFFFTDERYQRPGLARNYPYDTIILGNSLSENFRPSFVEHHTGWQTVNLAVSGGFAYEQHQLLDVALATGKPKRVIWGVSWDAFARPSRDRADLGGLPMYFYEHHPASLVTNYLLSISTLGRSLQGVLGRASHDLDLLNNFSADRTYGCEAMLSHYFSAYERQRFAAALETGQLLIGKEHLADSLEDHLFAPIGRHPDTHFYVFLPPTSIWFRRWAARYFPEVLVSFYEFRSLLIAGASRYANLTLLDYQSDPVILEPRRYSDLTHYSSEINDRIVLDIAQHRWWPPIGRALLEQQVADKDPCHADRRHQSGRDR